MSTKPVQSNEQIVTPLSDYSLHIIQDLAPQLEKAIAQKLDELERKIYSGQSKNGAVEVTVDGRHRVNTISIGTAFNDWDHSKSTTCELIAEAVNDAISKVDFEVETAIDSIQCSFSEELIEKNSKPGDIKNKYKRAISGVKDEG